MDPSDRPTVVESGDALPVHSAADLAGHELDGRYRLLRRVDAGSMGDVYEAIRLDDGVRVAIKILKPEHASRDTFRQRFLREAKSASRIDHPNVVRMLDYGESAEGTLYLAMEYLEGENLRDVVRREGRLGWSQAGPILVQLASALAAAHDAGVVHRDIKPSNVRLLGSLQAPVVKLLDFGVAKVGVDELSKPLTQAADVVGTILYISPEQAQGKPADPRSDLYALGVLAYEITTGRVPFSGDDIFEVMRQHLAVDPTPPRQLCPDLSPDAESCICCCLQKDPAARFENMIALSTALRATLSDQAPRTDPTSEADDFEEAPTAYFRSPAKRRPATATVRAPAVSSQLPIPSPVQSGATERVVVDASSPSVPVSPPPAASQPASPPAAVLPVGIAVVVVAVLGVLATLGWLLVG